jgi:hypothetical protein
LLHHACVRSSGPLALTWARGKPLSAAILYLAIVAIWACVLVPRWLHRSHDNSSDSEIPADSEVPGSPGEGDQESVGAPADDPEFATQSEQGGITWEDPVEAGASWDAASGSGSVEATYSVTAEYSEYSVTATYSAEAAHSGDRADRVAQGPPAAAAHHAAHEASGGPADRRRPPPVPTRAPGPSPHVLQARRRTLTMMVAITIGIMGAAFIGFTPWWTVVPPFVMLGLYLLLLREAAHADAEQARRHAEAHARARAFRAAQAARLRARQAQATPPPQPTAEIIDISARAAAADQPYDQYADAEFRAVGD